MVTKNVIIQSVENHYKTYKLHYKLECGIVLTGRQVMWLKKKQCYLKNAIVYIIDNVLYVKNLLHKQTNMLCAKKKQINRLKQYKRHKRCFIVPVTVYWKNNLVKLVVLSLEKQHKRRKKNMEKNNVLFTYNEV